MLIGIKDFTRCKNVRERVRCYGSTAAMAIVESIISNVDERFANASPAVSVPLFVGAEAPSLAGVWGRQEHSQLAREVAEQPQIADLVPRLAPKRG